MGLRVVDLVGDEHLHCLNTAGHKVESNMSCREETNTSLVRSSCTVLTVQKPTVELRGRGLSIYQGTVCEYRYIRHLRRNDSKH
jgi:hypothetical protein